jgi:hypothetical protein
VTETQHKVAIITGGSQGIGPGHMGQVSDIIFPESSPFITGEIPHATAARSPGHWPGARRGTRMPPAPSPQGYPMGASMSS